VARRRRVAASRRRPVRRASRPEGADVAKGRKLIRCQPEESNAQHHIAGEIEWARGFGLQQIRDAGRGLIEEIDLTKFRTNGAARSI
jgi:hypothetical protein